MPDVRGPVTNLSPLPDIGFQYQPDGLPWPSLIAAHNGTQPEYRAIGKSRFINDGSGLKEYWYKDGVSLAHLVPRFQYLETPQEFLEAIQTESAAAEANATLSQQIKVQMQEMLSEGTSYQGFWDPVDNIPNVSSVLPAGSYYIIGRTGSRNLGNGVVLYEEGRQLISNGSSYDQSPPIKPGVNTVSVETLAGWLRPLFQQLPESSPYIEVKIDNNNKKLWAIRKADGVIEGRFEIKESSMMPNSVNAASIKTGAIDYTKLAQTVKDLIYQSFDNSNSEYVKLELSANDIIITGIKKDGTFKIGKPELPANSVLEAWLSAAVRNKLNNPVIADGGVTDAKLSTSVKGRIQDYFTNTNSEWLDIVVDELSRIIRGTRKNGEYYIQRPSFPDRSLKESWLAESTLATLAKVPTPAFNRLNAANVNDVDFEADDLLRAVEIDIPVLTEAIGYRFAEFPRVKTPYIKGINDTGTAIQFIQSNSAVIRGRNFRGTFDPTASGIIGTNIRGNYGNGAGNIYPAFPAGSTGDCWVIDCGNTSATKTANGLTFKNGDMLVKTASGYDIQPGPGNGVFTTGDFWNVTAAGVFGGITLTTTSRVLFNGVETAGGPRHPKFLSSKKGEFYLMGECDPSNFAASATREGDLYAVSAAGTAQGIAVAIGDHLFYSGAWGVLQGSVKTIPNGVAFMLPCTNAREWSIRRADRTNTQVTIQAKGQRASVRQRASDEIWVLSDSMLGVNGTANKLAVLSGRNLTLSSFGGSTSEEELGMLKYYIRNGDLHAGKTLIVCHGQNNLNPDQDPDKVKRVAYEVYNSIGSAQKRVLFLSVLGARVATWNGTRIVVANHEDAFAGTNNIAKIEKFYQDTFPAQWASMRQILLAAAVGRTTPDLQFPGMTEAQVAATFQIVPASFFNEAAGKPNKALCNYVGVWSAAGLPTGGNDLDYYLRTGSGAVGRQLIKIAGVWTEFADDITHLSDTGAAALAAGLNTILTAKNI